MYQQTKQVRRGWFPPIFVHNLKKKPFWCQFCWWSLLGGQDATGLAIIVLGFDTGSNFILFYISSHTGYHVLFDTIMYFRASSYFCHLCMCFTHVPMVSTFQIKTLVLFFFFSFVFFFVWALWNQHHYVSVSSLQSAAEMEPLLWIYCTKGGCLRSSKYWALLDSFRAVLHALLIFFVNICLSAMYVYTVLWYRGRVVDYFMHFLQQRL